MKNLLGFAILLMSFSVLANNQKIICANSGFEDISQIELTPQDDGQVEIRLTMKEKTSLLLPTTLRNLMTGGVALPMWNGYERNLIMTNDNLTIYFSDECSQDSIRVKECILK